jgi:hypothetical protein
MGVSVIDSTNWPVSASCLTVCSVHKSSRHVDSRNTRFPRGVLVVDDGRSNEKLPSKHLSSKIAPRGRLAGLNISSPTGDVTSTLIYALLLAIARHFSTASYSSNQDSLPVAPVEYITPPFQSTLSCVDLNRLTCFFRLVWLVPYM